MAVTVPGSSLGVPRLAESLLPSAAVAVVASGSARERGMGPLSHPGCWAGRGRGLSEQAAWDRDLGDDRGAGRAGPGSQAEEGARARGWGGRGLLKRARGAGRGRGRRTQVWRWARLPGHRDAHGGLWAGSAVRAVSRRHCCVPAAGRRRRWSGWQGRRPGEAGGWAGPRCGLSHGTRCPEARGQDTHPRATESGTVVTGEAGLSRGAVAGGGDGSPPLDTLGSQCFSERKRGVRWTKR